MNEAILPSSLQIGASQGAIRHRNMALALNAIWTAQSLSRTELANVLGLSKPAIGRLIGELAALGYVAEQSHLPSGQRGRPRTGIVLDGGSRYCVGIDLRVDRMVVQAQSLSGNILFNERLPIERSLTAENMIAGVSGHLHRLTRQLGRIPSGIGIALPASFSDDGEEIQSSVYFDWNNVAFRALLAKALGPDYPRAEATHIANAAALANWRELCATSGRDLTHIQVGVGVGVGLLLANGDGLSRLPLFKRLAHMPLVPDGPLCACGAKGCLDAVVGFDAVATAASQCGISIVAGPEAMERICRSLAGRAAEGNLQAKKVIDDLAYWLGRAVATTLTLTRLNAFTIAGYPLFLGDGFWPPFYAAMEPHVPGAQKLHQPSRLGDDASVVGSVLLGIQNALANPQR